MSLLQEQHFVAIAEGSIEVAKRIVLVRSTVGSVAKHPYDYVYAAKENYKPGLVKSGMVNSNGKIN